MTPAENPPRPFFANTVPPTESLRTVADACLELSRSRATVKKIALEIRAPITKTTNGFWLFSTEAIALIRQKILRREREAQK